MKKTVIYVFIAAVFMSCGDNSNNLSETEIPSDKYVELNTQARQLFGVLPAVAENPNNIITDVKVELGKVLYFDNRLSKDNTQSCNTCHNLDTYGVDNKHLSEGNDGELGARNSPTTLNAAFHISQFWDGREPDVEAQAGGPILNPVEMAMPDEASVIEKLSKIDEYKELFSKAFPEEENPITYDNLKKAIGAFERKLVTPTKFDDYISGNDNALTDKEKDGLQTYINSGCIACHTGSLLGGNMYQKFGLFSNYWEHTNSEKVDEGKFEVTKNEADKYIFKVPSLRNIDKTGPYFHDGSINDLAQAIKIMAKTQSNKDLSEKEISEITEFLKTLTGTVPEELKQ